MFYVYKKLTSLSKFNVVCYIYLSQSQYYTKSQSLSPLKYS